MSNTDPEWIGDIQIKKEILADIGSNPVLLDGKLQIIPHPYLEPIEKEYKELEEKYLKVSPYLNR